MPKLYRAIFFFLFVLGIIFLVGQYPKLEGLDSLVLSQKGISTPKKTQISQTSLVKSNINITENQTIKKLLINASGKQKGINFPLGWYDHIHRVETPAKVATEGMNLLMPYTSNKNEATIRSYLDAAETAGMKVLLEPYRAKVKKGDIAAVTQFVRTFKQHPAVFGWYLYDEPAVKKAVSPETLEFLYNAIKAEDPNRPVAIVFAPSQIGKMLTYRKAFDICMIDRYPLFYRKREFNNLGDFWEWMQNAASVARDKKFWPVLQAFGEQEDGKPKYRRRLPTVAEERYMFYVAVNAGADGLFFYGHHWTLQSWIDSVLKPLIREFHQYIPAINSGPLSKKATVNRSDMQVLLYQNPFNKNYLAIAIHHGRGTVNPKIALDTSINTRSIKVVGEHRHLSLTKGIFKDSFGPYAVHLYEFH